MRPLETDRNSQLDFERVTFLFGSAGTGFLGLFLCTVFMAGVISELVSVQVGVIWAGSVLVTYMPRVILWRSFSAKLERGEITPDNVRPWERNAVLGSIVPYACYASAVFLPYGEGVETALLFFTIFAVLLIGGGSLMYSTSLGVLLIFLNFSLISIIVRSFFEGGRLLNVLAITLIAAHLMLHRVIFRLNRTMVESMSLRIDNAHLSFVDPLTKLWNRRRLDLFVEMLVPASKRSRQAFSVVLLDIDRFKEFNDTRGHQAGDDILVNVAQIIQRCARDQDLVVRYGGEEFLVVLPSTRREEAQVLAERILEGVRKATGVTVSAGVDEWQADRSFESVVEGADGALYAAKEAGRDAVRIAAGEAGH